MAQSGFYTWNTDPTQIPVTTTSTLLLKENRNREYAHFINNSTSRVYLQLGVPAVAGQGIPICPNAMYTITQDNLWLGPVYCIVGSGTANIDVAEAS